MENKIYYVYLHKTKDTHEIFHVGKGKDNRAQSSKSRNRFWKHVSEKHGFYVEMHMEGLTEISAYIQEILAIKFYKPRTNFLPGGTGGNSDTTKANFIRNPDLGRIVSEGNKKNYKDNPERALKHAVELSNRWKDKEYKTRVSNAISKAYEDRDITQQQLDSAAYARSFLTDESRAKQAKSISKALKGRSKPPRTPEHIAKIAAAKTGIKRTPESLLKAAITKGSKPFQVFSTTGELLGEWINKAECARALGLDDTYIGYCLRGKQKIHKNLTFKYKE